ncbi:MAG TPA: farnesyl diphosphate synthase [Tepidisphaeraceae bacterium]|jgi:geranylgeranyl diphosphate synthase type II
MAKDQSTSVLDQDLALELLKRHGERVEQYMRELIRRMSSSPAKLSESIEYSLMAGGKRLRPALILETFEACSPALGTQSAGASSALAAAGAMELIHTFSLVHDDLPAMDDDDLRRGRPTNHKVFGEAMAILAGDAMVTMAFDAIATDADPKVALGLIKELATATGPQGMIGGQVLDIEGENQSLKLTQLQQLHRMKTGALLTASCRMGAIAAGVSHEKLNAVSDYGRNLGLAFQIVDDILDVTSTPEQMGKATNKDHGAGKNTYPSLLGLEKSREAAEKALNAGLKALAPFGEEAEGLRALARFIVGRTF